MLIHVLGLSPNMDELIKICKKNIYLIEDTCKVLVVNIKIKILEHLEGLETYSFYYFPSNNLW